MSEEQLQYDLFNLRKANKNANLFSTCEKVRVGALIIDAFHQPHYGANRVMPGACRGLEACQTNGHCTSTIHAEIDAIIGARNLVGATIFVTRYPCENCARAIVAAGISTVVYGRPQRISKEVDEIFFHYNISVRHLPQFNPEGDVVGERSQ